MFYTARFCKNLFFVDSLRRSIASRIASASFKLKVMTTHAALRRTPATVCFQSITLYLLFEVDGANSFGRYLESKFPSVHPSDSYR